MSMVVYVGYGLKKHNINWEKVEVNRIPKIQVLQTLILEEDAN